MEIKRKEKYRKGVFIIVYFKSKQNIEYLILNRKLHWKGWEFPKGKIERFETKKIAVKRELKEETGLSPIKIKSFKEKGKYKYKKILADRPEYIGQTYSLFAVEVKKGKIKIDKREHLDYKWVDFKNALEKLTFSNQQKCLRIVNLWLNGK